MRLWVSMKYNFWLIAIVFLGFVLRVYQLGEVPRGVTHDEMGYIYNSYSIAKTGKNVLGESYPFLNYLVRAGYPFMPTPTYLSVIVFKFLPLSAFAGRLPNALMGTISVALIYFLAKQLFKKETVALLSASALAIMPWHIFFSRTAYDIGTAAFFYLLAATSFFTYPVLSIVSFLLALFSYRGMVPLAVPLMALLLIYGKIVRKRLGVAILGFLLVIGIFVGVALINRNRGFLAEATIDLQKIAWEVELMRRDSAGPTKFKEIFLNKPLYIANRWVTNYFYAYSVGHLFVHGEASQIYTMYMRGKLYMIDALLLFTGVYFLIRKKQHKGSVFFALGLLAVSGIPGAIAGEPYATRTFPLTIPLALILGAGADGLIHLRIWGKLLATALIGVYLFSFSYFLFDYYERYTYQRGDVWVSDMKDVRSTIASYPDPRKKVLLTGTTLGDMLQYAFYARSSPLVVQDAWKKAQGELLQKPELDGVVFGGNCNDTHRMSEVLNLGEYSIVFGRPNCFDQEKPDHVIRDFYKNTIWNVYYPK